jgi:hypothetical protein
MNSTLSTLGILAALQLWVPFAAPAAAPDIQPAEEWVLNYHLMHPGGGSMPGDPNPAFHIDGVCHLHYILRHP